MKQFKQLAFISLTLIVIGTSCKTDETTTTDLYGNWIRRSAFEGNGRQGAVSFVIGDTAYVLAGYDGGTSRLGDFYAYDPTTDSWRSRPAFPGTKRNSAVGFAIGTKGYITTGYDGISRLQDTWEYNQANGQWTKVADLPDIPNTTAGSGARYGAIGFAIGSKGYVCGGYNGSHQKDLWEYNQATNTWTQLISMGGQKRQGASVLVYGGKAYVFGGVNNGSVVNDMWQFDPTNATTPWKALNNITNTSSETFDDNYTSITRSYGSAFIIADKGYFSTGENGSFMKTTWEYDFATDRWTRKNDFERQERSGAVGFNVKGRGYIALGKNSTYYWDDVDEFKPGETLNSND